MAESGASVHLFGWPLQDSRRYFGAVIPGYQEHFGFRIPFDFAGNPARSFFTL